MAATVLADFARSFREEPLHYIYRHKIWLTKDKVETGEVHDWLKKRYVESKQGHRYRVRLYKDDNGQKYVDSVLLETLSEEDLIYMNLRWGFSKDPVTRHTRKKNRRLTKEQRARRAQLLADFYASLDQSVA